MGTIFTSMQFKLWATIDKTEVELVQFSCVYEMNAIPRCSAMLPVGYRVLPPFTASSAHTVTNGIQVQIPLKVYCEVKFLGGQYPLSAPLPATYLIFDGYVTGVGYRRTYDGYTMNVEGTHWLSNLSYSSIMSETISPLAPTQFTFNARMYLGANARGEKDQTSCLPVTMVQTLSTPGNVQTDLWGKVLQPWFIKLASTNRMNQRLLQLNDQDINPNNDTKRGEVVHTLRRFPGERLPFDTTRFEAGTSSISTMIGKELANVQNPRAMGERLARQTFWDKLVGELSPTYMFKIIPYASIARVVPFIPGLRAVWSPHGEDFTFKASDIEVQDSTCHLPRQLRALCVFGGVGLRANATGQPANKLNNFRIGGAYVGGDTGMVVVREAPSFLFDTKLAHRFTGQITNLHGNAFNHPGAGAAPAGVKPDDIGKDALKMLDVVAHAWYVAEVLQNRYGDISTPLRFDVAPGSSVKIEGTSGAFMHDGEDRYGQVVRVGYMFDAQQQQCRSQYRIANMHTGDEHMLDQFTTDTHPFYLTTWPGDEHMRLE